MHRIDGPGNANGQFVEESLTPLRPPTEVTADWLNAAQEEIISVVASENIDLDKESTTQLLEAIDMKVLRVTPRMYFFGQI